MYKYKEMADYANTLPDKQKIWDEVGSILEKHFEEFSRTNPDEYQNIMELIYCEIYGKMLSQEMAEKWVKCMSVPEGSLAINGEKWNLDEAKEMAVKSGIEFVRFNEFEWYAILNAMYSDNFEVAQKYSVADDPEFFIDLAMAWLMDDDVQPNKTYNYYKNIVK